MTVKLGQGLSLAEISSRVGGRILGDGSRMILGVAPLDEAGPSDLSILVHPKYRREAVGSKAGALLVKEGFELEGRDQVVLRDPHAGLAILLEQFGRRASGLVGVSPRAEVAASARLGESVSVGPFAVVEADCTVGARAMIGAGCYVGAGSEIGDDAVLHPGAIVLQGCRLGNRVILHSGVVIGSDGFGYATAEGIHSKIPQAGTVVIEDDVEIGAGTTIDRGSIGATRIGRGTKIDNLVQIGHNVRIGSHCLIVAQSGISGSTRIGDSTVMAGQSGAAGHLRIGARSMIASKSAVYEDLQDGAFVAGIPAIDHRRWKRAQASFARLPELQARLRDLGKRVGELEDALKSAGSARVERKGGGHDDADR